MNEQVTLPNLLSATIDTLQRYREIAMIYLAVMVPVATISRFLSGKRPDELISVSLEGGEVSSFLAEEMVTLSIELVGFVLSVLAYYWLIAAMTRGTLRPGFDRLGPFIGIYILAFLGILLGFAMLVVPGFIVLCRWMPVLPAVIARDQDAMSAFNDAWEMTSGKGWSIFGAGLIIVIAMSVVGTVLGGVGDAVEIHPIFGDAVESIADEVSTIVFAAFAVGAFNLMRDKSDELTEVFE